MSERGDAPKPSAAETGQPEKPVFDFRDPDVIFEEGVKIVGMQTWEDVNKLVELLSGQAVAAVELPHHNAVRLITRDTLQERVRTIERSKGFNGNKPSSNFEIEMLVPDQSVEHTPRRAIKPDPRLVKTFRLSRKVYSTRFPRDGVTVLTLCTVVLTKRDMRTDIDSGSPRSNLSPIVPIYSQAIGVKDLSQALWRDFSKGNLTGASMGADRNTRIGIKKG